MPGATTATNTATTAASMEQQSSSHIFKLSVTSCGTCGISFDSPETRRSHSKSQWHVTNLRRRIADLEPLTATQFAAAERPAAPTGPTTADPSSEESSSSVSDAEIDSGPEHSGPEDDFVSEECLFCNTVSDDFDDNVTHMHKAHGMFIPDQERLIVDLDTLVRYLHLVIHAYHECLQCGTQRLTLEAVQQHMMGKNHCRFDINAKDSEYRDFYEKPAEDDGEEAEQENETRKAIADAIEEGGSIRLPSGKILSHRSAPGCASRQRNKIRWTFDRSASSGNILNAVSDIDESDASMRLTAPRALGKNNSTALLTRAEKQEAIFETHLAHLSIDDRAAIAHLSAAEQRSVLLAKQKQLDKSNRANRRLQTRLEMKANKTGQGQFVHDVMGPRFSVHLYGYEAYAEPFEA